MRAIVHIGFPKTGTSSVVGFLKENRRVLSDQGILFEPDHYAGREAKHWKLPAHALNEIDRCVVKPAGDQFGLGDLKSQKEAAKDIPAQLRRFSESKSHNTVIFSSDHFSNFLIAPEEIASLARLVSETFEQSQYVVYLREPKSDVISSYSQRLKGGGTVSLQDHVLENTGRFRNKAKLLFAWADNVPEGTLDVNIFGEIGPIERICQLIGTNHDGFIKPRRKNVSLTAKGMAVLLIINHRLQETYGKPFVGKKRWPLIEAIHEETATSPKAALNRDEIAMLDAANERPLERLRQRFFPERTTLFPPHAQGDAHPDELTQNEEVQILADQFFERVPELMELQNAT